ncbi:cupin domain-containing protein [Frankia sp. AgB1.9]|uniref:hypothetical protein n=1 Tax=unclassified Frankia TaxID=2632575 RepID=UPI00193296C4|nr:MULTISPECIES: hypothetical protein [unclassified Frankia]MBL7487650.1 cupin domain-containing protein [Frankia sp. AgW1.1]MBL7550028.1 cupin domain-containing protein [Frankia sp. AgB1.9]MBL7621907.1 hypothetical protein [Frankia sp. AgB1.8]
MRRFVTGVDVEGRSCLVEEAALDLVADPGFPGFLSAVVAATSAAPPPARPAGQAFNASVLGVAPGLVSWLIVDYEANIAFPMHHTDTLDYDLLLDGSMVLGLEDGDHALEAGDIVIVNGVDHSWRAGPEGARLSVLSIGTPPPG